MVKAFDCLNHEVLLTVLHFCGIWGVSLDCFMSYLTNRRQKVEVVSHYLTQNFFSVWGVLKHGVPQGSIIGPLLFIIYVCIYENDPLKIILFTDDTSVIISSRNFKDFCSHMIKWFATNNLVLNLDATNMMKFITKNSSLHFGYKKSIYKKQWIQSFLVDKLKTT